ncbi:hypothetical protein CO669_13605 [Bradyrhizobium sp. Y36]|uniref:hypothetical protein n=1 Tax=Bradyrhizobium sp. Y36 TaxID=2035447 RepID=UPI000BE9212F|nr:hypothetical protein [Bradyrhizobium sp. Y36]PDT89818.1 hypothetical protein CO669_13605 [Bradyrhizobium sp. Y36]
MTLQMCEEAAMTAIALHAARRESAPRPPAAAPKPLDPDVLSAAIPAFFIGRNRAGLWVAREASGRVGGLFLLKSSAIEFANRHSAPARCALVFPNETFELDIENCGNPLIRLAEAARRRLAGVARMSPT